MENEEASVSWAELKDALMRTSTANRLLRKLREKTDLSLDEIMLMNLLMQEEASSNADKTAQKIGFRTADASWEAASAARASSDFAKKTSESTRALKTATIWLAIMTGVLAFSTIADIWLRFLCRT